MQKSQREKLTAKYRQVLLIKYQNNEENNAYYEGKQAMIEDIMDMFYINYHDIKKDVKKEIKEEAIKQEAMDLMFSHIAENLDLKSGDIDPSQQETLDILLKNYITQNTI